MNKNEFLDVLTARLAERRAERRSSLQAEIDRLDNAWSETERRNPYHPKGGNLDAWSRDLLNLRIERLNKYEGKRARLVTSLTELSDDSEFPAIDIQLLNSLLETIDNEITKYQSTLSLKRRQLEFIGEYGNIENTKWIAEISKFAGVNTTVSNGISRLKEICERVSITIDLQEYVTRRVNEMISPANTLPEPVVSDGIGFERSCLATLKQYGWEGNLTRSSGDQGVDIIAKKGDRSVAIQCKNYKTPVGNGAVQEVHAGMTFYEVKHAVVVSPSGFTASANKLSKKLGVLLVDYSMLSVLDEILSKKI